MSKRHNSGDVGAKAKKARNYAFIGECTLCQCKYVNDLSKREHEQCPKHMRKVRAAAAEQQQQSTSVDSATTTLPTMSSNRRSAVEVESAQVGAVTARPTRSLTTEAAAATSAVKATTQSTSMRAAATKSTSTRAQTTVESTQVYEATSAVVATTITQSTSLLTSAPAGATVESSILKHLNKKKRNFLQKKKTLAKRIATSVSVWLQNLTVSL